MDGKKKKKLISFILFLIAIVFTILVKLIDVKAIGPDNSVVGFATINQFVFDNIGVNMFWYKVSDLLGLIPFLLVLIYAFYGFIQLVKRKHLFKINKEILLLGGYYVVVFMLYILFEKFIVNYRPVLLDGVLEASYPSSHTLMGIFICGSAILVNKKIFSKKIFNIFNILLFFILTSIVFTRLISGVHWFTDIIGGIIISGALLMSFSCLLDVLKKEN